LAVAYKCTNECRFGADWEPLMVFGVVKKGAKLGTLQT